MKLRAHRLAVPAVFALLFAMSGSAQAQGPAGYVGNGRVTGRIASAFSRQNLEPADQATTAKIREAIAVDASLSADARRIQISTSHGRVTLLGARSEERRVGKECRSRRSPCAEKKKK